MFRKHAVNTYNILLIGETGSGKSTLINYLTNYFYDGSLDNLKIAIPTKYHKATEEYEFSEKNLHDVTMSQTRECTVYSFTKSNCCYDFIDTPGLSDTEGTEQDDQHITKIMSVAEKRGSMSAIIVVINGTVARATVNLRNTLVRLRGSIPDVLLNNLIIVLTNCSKATSNFYLKTLEPWIVPKDNVFYMNNSALSKSPDLLKDDDYKIELGNHWKSSMKEIEKVIARIKNLGNIATNAFEEMRKKRNKIKAELNGMLLEVKKLQTIQSKLESAKVAQKEIADNIVKYSNFKQNKQVEYTEMVETDYHNTLCMQHNDKICHEKCGLDFTTTVGEQTFKHCACMSGPKCTFCECGHTTHFHSKAKPVKKTKTVEEIIQDIKILYDKNTAEGNNLRNKITNLSSDLEAIKDVLKKKEAEISECCRALKKLCSQFNFVDELNSVIDAMKANARTLTSNKIREEANTMIKNIVHLVDELSKRESK